MAAFSPPGSANGRSDPDVVARATHELATTDLTGALPAIRAPLTVVYAAPDRATQTAIDRTFASAYANAPGAHLIRIDGSGHMIMQDQPARFQAALRDFLR
jgi:pimeloyl-ACP methyl ester carboxylesterase